MSRAKPEPQTLLHALPQQRAARQKSSNAPGVAGVARPIAPDAQPLPWVAKTSEGQGSIFRQGVSVPRPGAQVRIRVIRARARQLAIVTRGVHNAARAPTAHAAPAAPVRAAGFVDEAGTVPAANDNQRMSAAGVASAVGHLFTEANAPELAHLMRSIEQGDSSLASQIARRILGAIAVPAVPQPAAVQLASTDDVVSSPPPQGPLSPRELKVLQLMARGWSNRQIADEIHRSINTIEAQLKSIYRKLAVKSRMQAVREAMQSGLLNWDDTAPV